MSTEEKIEAAGKRKEEGNVLFKLGKYERASKRYEKVEPEKCIDLLPIICFPLFLTEPYTCRL